MFTQNPLFDLPSLESVIDRAPLTLPPHTSVAFAIALMSQAQENRCELLDTDISPSLESLNRERNSCILVVEGKKLVGIFTEKDAVKLAASQRDLNGIAIAEVMRRKLITEKAIAKPNYIDCPIVAASASNSSSAYSRRSRTTEWIGNYQSDPTNFATNQSAEAQNCG